MKKRLVLILMVALLLSGCVPTEYRDGVKLDRDYPDKELPIYDDAIVYECEADDEEIVVKYGTEDDIDDVIDFYMDYFEDEDIAVEQEDDDDEYTAEGRIEDFEFEIEAGEAKGQYEEKVFATTVEVVIEFTDDDDSIIESRAEQSANISNAQVIASCVNAHNAMPDNENKQITLVQLWEIADDSEHAAKDGDDAAMEFNEICDNQISMENKDFIGAMPYLETISDDSNDLMVNTTPSSSTPAPEATPEPTSTPEPAPEPADELLEKMQGFWLVVAVDYEDYYDADVAFEIHGNNLDSYIQSRVPDDSVSFSFIDDHTIRYEEDGEVNDMTVDFVNSDGVLYMTLEQDGTALTMVRISYDDFMIESTVKYDWEEVLEDTGQTEYLDYYVPHGEAQHDDSIADTLIEGEWIMIYNSPIDGVFNYEYSQVFYADGTTTYYGTYDDVNGDSHTHSGTNTWYVKDQMLHEVDSETGEIYYGHIEVGYDDSRGIMEFLYVAFNDTSYGSHYVCEQR